MTLDISWIINQKLLLLVPYGCKTRSLYSSITAQVWVPIEKNTTSAYVPKSICAELIFVFNVNVT